jgi:hypothetical protein
MFALSLPCLPSFDPRTHLLAGHPTEPQLLSLCPFLREDRLQQRNSTLILSSAFRQISKVRFNRSETERGLNRGTVIMTFRCITRMFPEY